MLDNNDLPKISESWSQPCLVDNQDGKKVEYYERDMSPEAIKVTSDIMACIRQQQNLSVKFEHAKIIVEHMVSLQSQQALLLEKLESFNIGKRILEAEGEAVLTEVAEDKHKNKESK